MKFEGEVYKSKNKEYTIRVMTKDAECIRVVKKSQIAKTIAEMIERLMDN